jgi:hypothetical protein
MALKCESLNGGGQPVISINPILPQYKYPQHTCHTDHIFPLIKLFKDTVKINMVLPFNQYFHI